jgi:hypothetical protein
MNAPFSYELDTRRPLRGRISFAWAGPCKAHPSQTPISSGAACGSRPAGKAVGIPTPGGVG